MNYGDFRNGHGKYGSRYWACNPYVEHGDISAER